MLVKLECLLHFRVLITLHNGIGQPLVLLFVLTLHLRNFLLQTDRHILWLTIVLLDILTLGIF